MFGPHSYCVALPHMVQPSLSCQATCRESLMKCGDWCGAVWCCVVRCGELTGQDIPYMVIERPTACLLSHTEISPITAQTVSVSIALFWTCNFVTPPAPPPNISLSLPCPGPVYQQLIFSAVKATPNEKAWFV